MSIESEERDTPAERLTQSYSRALTLASFIRGLFTRPRTDHLNAEPESPGSGYEMVQTYGVAEENDGARGQEEIVDSAQGEETSALLGSGSTAKGIATKSDGPASLTSSVGNLANTIIGSGAFPVNYLKAKSLINARHVDISSCKASSYIND